MLNEEIEALPIAVRGGRIVATSGRMVGAWDNEKIEDLVVLNQLIDDLYRRRRIDIRIELPDHEK